MEIIFWIIVGYFIGILNTNYITPIFQLWAKKYTSDIKTKIVENEQKLQKIQDEADEKNKPNKVGF